MVYNVCCHNQAVWGEKAKKGAYILYKLRIEKVNRHSVNSVVQKRRWSTTIWGPKLQWRWAVSLCSCGCDHALSPEFEWHSFTFSVRSKSKKKKKTISKKEIRYNHLFDDDLNEIFHGEYGVKRNEDEKEYANQQITDWNSMNERIMVKCAMYEVNEWNNKQTAAQLRAGPGFVFHGIIASATANDQEKWSLVLESMESAHVIIPSYSETICHNKIPFKNYQIIKYHILYLRPTLCPQTIETTVTIQ